jgi:hypothetical protein
MNAFLILLVFWLIVGGVYGVIALTIHNYIYMGSGILMVCFLLISLFTEQKEKSDGSQPKTDAGS